MKLLIFLSPQLFTFATFTIFNYLPSPIQPIIMDLKKLIIEALEDQKEIFGDELYQQIEKPEQKLKKVADIQESNDDSTQERIEPAMTKNLFQEDFEKAESLEEIV